MTTRVYTLPEVAQMTRIPLKVIKRGCRAGEIEHTITGGRDRLHRGMTQAQIDLLLETRRSGATATPAQVPAPTSDLEAILAHARSRPTRRRRAA